MLRRPPERRLLRRLPSILAALLVAAASLTAPGCSRVRPAPERPLLPDTLHFMTYNIHHGRGIDGRLDLARIARVILDGRADVVALQEVDRGVERSERRDVLAELSELTGMPHYAFGKNIDHQGGDYGNAILSRYPITASRNTHLRQHTPAERRGVLQAVVDLGGRDLAVLVTHFDFRDEEERLYSTRQIEEEILPAFEAYPVILAGDINDVPGGQVHERLKTLLHDAWEQAGEGPGYTIPVDAPNRRIDYVFHDAALVPLTARVPRTQASDHLPVVVGFRFAE